MHADAHGRGARVVHRAGRGRRRPAARPAAAPRSSRCARRRKCRRGANGSQIDQFPFIRTYFQTIATATVAKSALEAKELGYLRAVRRRGHERARGAARGEGAGAGAGRRGLSSAAAARATCPVVGKTGFATLQMLLVNMRDGGFISAYDFEVGLRVARVLCGGEVEPGSLVDENWLLEARARANSWRCCATRRRRRASRTRLPPASRCGTREARHEQTDAGRVHRRLHAHRRRQGAARRVPLDASRHAARARAAQRAGAGARDRRQARSTT